MAEPAINVVFWRFLQELCVKTLGNYWRVLTFCDLRQFHSKVFAVKFCSVFEICFSTSIHKFQARILRFQLSYWLILSGYQMIYHVISRGDWLRQSLCKVGSKCNKIWLPFLEIPAFSALLGVKTAHVVYVGYRQLGIWRLVNSSPSDTQRAPIE